MKLRNEKRALFAEQEVKSLNITYKNDYTYNYLIAKYIPYTITYIVITKYDFIAECIISVSILKNIFVKSYNAPGES